MASEDSGGDAGMGAGYAEGDQRLDVLPLHSTDLLTLLDENGIVQYESPSIERLYGFGQDELVGQQVAAYFHPEDRERVMAAFETIVESDEHRVEAVEYRHRQADGSYKWIESVGSTNPTPEGNYVINSRNISERKAREAELRRAREHVRSERDGKEAIRELLLETSTDGEIAASVCRLLVESYGYEAAWVVCSGDDDSVSTATVASHGIDRDSWQATGTEHPFAAVTRRALDSGEPEAVTTGSDYDRDTAERLLERGLAAVRTVPLKHDGITDGALTVVRRDTNEGIAAELLDEFAGALAFKRQVHRRQAALVAETVTELGIRITSGHFLLTLSADPDVPGDARLSAEELHRDDDGLVTYLLTAEGVDAATLHAAGEQLDATQETALVTDGDGDPDSVVRMRVDEPTVGAVLSAHGGALQSIVAGDGCVDVTVHLPRQTAVPTVINSVREHWPEATMHSRTERDVERERPARFGELTEKQEDALRAATLAGFFERPQQASAADIAETLGVSRSTFLYHLRNAERKVFEDAFGPE